MTISNKSNITSSRKEMLDGKDRVLFALIEKVKKESEDIQRLRGVLRYTTSGTTTSGIHGILATRTRGSLALSQRATFRLNLSHLCSVCELCTHLDTSSRSVF